MWLLQRLRPENRERLSFKEEETRFVLISALWVNSFCERKQPFHGLKHSSNQTNFLFESTQTSLNTSCQTSLFLQQSLWADPPARRGRSWGETLRSSDHSGSWPLTWGEWLQQLPGPSSDTNWQKGWSRFTLCRKKSRKKPVNDNRTKGNPN